MSQPWCGELHWESRGRAWLYSLHNVISPVCLLEKGSLDPPCLSQHSVLPLHLEENPAPVMVCPCPPPRSSPPRPSPHPPHPIPTSLISVPRRARAHCCLRGSTEAVPLFRALVQPLHMAGPSHSSVFSLCGEPSFLFSLIALYLLPLWHMYLLTGFKD